MAPTLFACFALGIPVNTLDATFKRDDLGHMPTLVFCDQETIEEMSAAMKIAGIPASVVIFGKRVEGFMHVDDLLVPTGVEEEFV